MSSERGGRGPIENSFLIALASSAAAASVETVRLNSSMAVEVTVDLIDD